MSTLRQRLPRPTRTCDALRGGVQSIAIVVAAGLMFLLAGALVVIDVAATTLWMPAVLTSQGWIAGYILAMVAAYGASVVLDRCHPLSRAGQPG